MPKQVLELLQQKIIPWVEQFGLSQIVVARHTLSEMHTRFGFEYSPRRVLGPRCRVRAFTFNMTTAKWPRDHLIETANPLLTFILEGEADMRFKDYWLRARRGQAVFTPSHTPRKDGSVPYLHPRNQQFGYCSTLNFSVVRGFISIWRNYSRGKTHEGEPGKKHLYILNNHAVQLLQQLEFHFVQTDSGSEIICGHLLKAFLAILEKDLQEERCLQEEPAQKSIFLNHENHDPIVEAQRYIRAHFYETLTLQSMARHVCMSRAQFAAQFHQKSGQTFNDFLTQRRIEHAKVLLQETDCTLTFICHNIGYHSLTYFRRLFIRKVGIAPLEYRKKHKYK